MDSFPAELLDKIFRVIDPISLSRCACVCKSFYIMITSMKRSGVICYTQRGKRQCEYRLGDVGCFEIREPLFLFRQRPLGYVQLQADEDCYLGQVWIARDIKEKQRTLSARTLLKFPISAKDMSPEDFEQVVNELETFHDCKKFKRMYPVRVFNQKRKKIHDFFPSSGESVEGVTEKVIERYSRKESQIYDI